MLLGNQALKETLAQHSRRGLSHAYLLSGPKGSGRHTLAQLLCGWLLCEHTTPEGPCGQCGPCKKLAAGIHPDVQVVAGPGEGKPIPVDRVRQMRADAYIRPNEGRRKIYLLEQADRMNQSAQNAMLKLLEDGPPYAVFLLLAQSPGGVLETVRSRCEELHLSPLSAGQVEQALLKRFPQESPQKVREIAALSQGILGQGIALLEQGGELEHQREQARLLAMWMTKGDELGLLEFGLSLDKAAQEELEQLFHWTRQELTQQIKHGQPAPLRMRGIALLQELETAAQFHVNAGQLMGWLCAKLFDAPQG